jgi:CBS domain-containing protein/anti-sigma regulatory factor (Ser/Thr protein kinase)
MSAQRITKTQEMIYEMKVGEVMTKNVITVRPENRMSELREILQHNRISGLPVVEGDRLVGLVSLEDFMKWIADRQGDCTIDKRMTKDLKVLCADDPLVLAVGKFGRTGLGRFPVVDRSTGRLLGIMTKGDVIAGLLKKLEIDYQKEQSERQANVRIIDDIEADETKLLFAYEVRGQDFKLAGRSSSRLKKTLKVLGLDTDVVRRVAIASYEAEMNLVVFTEGGMIQARVEPARVILEVVDAGPGIADIDRAMTPGYSTAPDWVREMGFGAGMGLVNIQRSADEFDIDSAPGRGTHLRITFCCARADS